MENPTVFNIQKYSIHDGNGIRTTLFFKGCPLSCQWCHNPESQRYPVELLYYHERCTYCGTCVEVCPQKASVWDGRRVKVDRSKCTACGICADECLAGAREIAGKTYTVDELVQEAAKDQMFYEESGGGVTLSGGEVMCQDMDFIETLCKKLSRRGYSIDIDTCGYAPYENFARILPYVDVFLYDIKLMDPEKHKKFVGVDNHQILQNLIQLNRDGAKINIRIPVIQGVNAEDSFIKEVIRFLQENQIRTVGVNLLPYHNTGKSKYANLDRGYAEELYKVPPTEQMERFRQMFQMSGFQNIKIGG